MTEKGRKRKEKTEMGKKEKNRKARKGNKNFGKETRKWRRQDLKKR